MVIITKTRRLGRVHQTDGALICETPDRWQHSYLWLIAEILFGPERCCGQHPMYPEKVP